MYNDHSTHVAYGHASLDDNEVNKAAPIVDSSNDTSIGSGDPSAVKIEQARFDKADAASQRIFDYVVSALNGQEANKKLDGVTYEDIQDNTGFGYSFVKNRMAEILEVTDEIKVEPGSGRRPSRFFSPHQYLERQVKREHDSNQPSGQSDEDESCDDEQSARKTVLASMKRQHKRLTKVIEEAQAELKDRESAIRILEKDIDKS